MNKVLMAAGFLCVAMRALALTETVDGLVWSYKLVSGGASVDRGTGREEPAIDSTVSGEVVVPVELGGQPVVSLGKSAFQTCRNMTSIVLPETITVVDKNAFHDCVSLSRITIPAKVTRIGAYAFEDCDSLTSMTFPEGVETLDHDVFLWCDGLVSVTLPSTLKSVGFNVFYGCDNLKSIRFYGLPPSFSMSDWSDYAGLTIEYPRALAASWEPLFVTGGKFERATGVPFDDASEGNFVYEEVGGGIVIKGVKTVETEIVIPAALNGKSVIAIGEMAFNGAKTLTTVKIADGVQRIGAYAFNNCEQLVEVSLPESVTEIGAYAFAGCKALEGVVLPSRLTMLSDALFRNCERLAAVNIPGGVRSIGASAFENCAALSTIVLPEGVSVVKDLAFAGCVGLTSLSLPSTLVEIGVDAFKGCVNLAKILVRGDVPRGVEHLSSGWDMNRYILDDAHKEAWERKFVQLQRAQGMLPKVSADVVAEMKTEEQMAVRYKVKSHLSTVTVRAVAFADGVRSFANILPVKSGEGIPTGEQEATNKEYTFVWNVAQDWSQAIGEITVDILIREGATLPQDLVTLPATAEGASKVITQNAIPEALIFNALLWYWAEGDAALLVNDGVLSINGVPAVDGATVKDYTLVLNYLYGKQGYKVLDGADLLVAEEVTHQTFADEGPDQVSIQD